MSLGSFLSVEKWRYSSRIVKLIFFVDGKSGVFGINEYLTITDWAALVRGLNGFGAGQDRTDDRITDDSPLLEEESLDLHSAINTQTPPVQTKELLAARLYLAATGETLVVVWSPAGAVSVMLVLEETGLRVFFQLLHVFHEEVVKLPILLLLLPPGAELTGVWHVDL